MFGLFEQTTRWATLVPRVRLSAPFLPEWTVQLYWARRNDIRPAAASVPVCCGSTAAAAAARRYGETDRIPPALWATGG